MSNVVFWHPRSPALCNDPPPLVDIQRAGEAYAAGRYRSAVDLFTEAIGVDEEEVHTSALLHAKRAAALMNLGKNKDALKDCAQASGFTSKRLRLLVSTLMVTTTATCGCEQHLALVTHTVTCTTRSF